MFAKSVKTEWGPRGIRGNSLSPGYVHADLIKRLLGTGGKEKVDAWLKDIHLGRMVELRELRSTIVWMVSETGKYLKGSDVVRSFKRAVVGLLICVDRLWMEGYTAW